MTHKRLTDDEKKARAEARKLAREAKLVTPPEKVEVSENEEVKKSLFEKFTGGIQVASPTRKKTRSKKVDPTIITKVAPLVVSGFAVSFIRQRIPEPYKICAPTQDEVVAMVKPLFNILSRYVEITGHLSENTLDLITALLSSIIYGTRAYVTYVNIQEYNNARPDSLGDVRPVEPGSTIYPFNSGTNSVETNRNTKDIVVQEPYATNGHADDSTNNSSNERYEAEKLDNLFKRDIEGRRRLGLL